jgi:hypothetical protein
MGRRWRDYPMYKIKSLELKRSDLCTRMSLKTQNSLGLLESSNTQMHNYIILKSKASYKDGHIQAYPFHDLLQNSPWIPQVTGSK